MRDKVFIITGSSQGIGRATAYQLAQMGAKIILNGRNPKKLEQSYKEFQEEGFTVETFVGDVSNPIVCKEMVDYTIRQFGQLDYLINNAALSAALSPVATTHPTVFKNLFNTNVLGVINMTIAALPTIKKSKGGILFISSLAGIFGLPEAAAYSSSKMALTGFAESLKLELEGSGVYVGIAYLSFVENDAQKTVFNAKGQLIPQPKHQISKSISPEKIAQQLIQMIRRRKFRQYFSGLGKLFYYLNRFSPWLLEKIMLRIYRNRRQKETIEKSNLHKLEPPQKIKS